MRDDSVGPEVLRALGANGDYRLLRRLDVKEGLTGVGGRENTRIGIVVDVETTGVSEDDIIIEIAVRRFRFDPDGVIVRIDRPYSWLHPTRRTSPVRPWWSTAA